MNDGFLKVAAATPAKIVVADCQTNTDYIIERINEALSLDAKLLVLPELCITAYTCEDLFSQSTLINAALESLKRVQAATLNTDMLVVVGLPFAHHSTLYNVAAVIHNGKLLGLVPKSSIPNHAEAYEGRHFAAGSKTVYIVNVNGEEVPFGTNILFRCKNIPDFILGVEICEDVWSPMPPSISHALNGATVIANLSASPEMAGKDKYRTDLIKNQSARIVSAYIYADTGEGESTTDLVFSGHNIIAENGTILAETEQYYNSIAITDIDLERIAFERRRTGNFVPTGDAYTFVDFEMNNPECMLDRPFAQSPFVPLDTDELNDRCSEIFMLQTMGLKKRLSHIGCKTAVIGISGGLDSTLTLLVTANTFDHMMLDRSNIIAVTMPCFGTTDRTYNNAVELSKKLGATFKEVRINKAVLQHFEDIGHDKDVHDLTFENAQARERTQVLMDIAGSEGGIVIGTGDLSELALGWATYNGDHMSMYGVNGGIPKTLIRHVVRYYADTCEDDELKRILLDVLDTPVSPELLPPKDGEINQKTEDIVGPYELHDYFIYYALRFGYSPKKIYRIAKESFAGIYDDATIYKWLSTFYRRFFSQQFKRSCLPDGPKIGSVGISPRGDLRMPSDASAALWLHELENLLD
ncbi:MAG: NAD(+) synthase [Lachnospiraceae bacterium]|nr:NAD(+) synthase [Lachnospiraceae bacterium]